MASGYITPKENKYPEADVILFKDEATGQNFWVVEVCPYCRKQHRHWAGDINDDPKSYLGHHPSHCIKKYPSDRGYMLIEKCY